MIGKTISHYKILEKLGSGSMGTVYKAEDTKLKRIVALKFLPPHLITGNTEKKRFLHEAQSASALNHPNIITIYDIVEEIDKVFIVMEYCDGKMLSEKLKDSPLKQRELLDIGIGVAEGLHAAHDANITHRDIKSQNIIVSEDCPPKIIDFGIAKQKGMTNITKNGTTLGTQCYMSPEQLHGAKVDKRSDIFSFGVVLYEMATGKLPFTGKFDAEILYSVVNEEPIPITTLNPNMDAELQRIVDKALKKDVKDRYQHIDELLADLRNLKKKRPSKTITKPPWWRIPVYSIALLLAGVIIYSLIIKDKADNHPSKKSIAVLPFTTIDRTEESEIFGEGIHDDILTQIAKVRDLKVIARTSVIKYKNSNLNIKDIANELNVKSILEGSVRRSGDKIRIVAQLIDPDTEEHIWADTYDRDYADIFDIQSDVAQKIAIALETTLSSKELQEIEKIPTKNLEAYEQYVQGKMMVKDNSFISAISHFEKAIEHDSHFVEAYAMLARAYLLRGWIGYGMTDNILEKAKQNINKALDLNSSNIEVVKAEAYYYFHGLANYNKALEKFKIALQYRPNDSDILYAMGRVKLSQGYFEESLQLYINALNIDPRSSSKMSGIGFIAFWLRNYKLAEQYYNQSLQINPNQHLPYIWKIRTAINTGDLKTAMLVRDEAIEYIHPYKLLRERAEIEYYNRNYLGAFNIREEYKNDSTIFDMQNLYFKGKYLFFNGDVKKSKSIFKSLLLLCDKEIIKYNEGKKKANQNEWIPYAFKTLAYAYLAIKDKALSTAEHVTKLLPTNYFYIDRITWAYDLINVYIQIGEHRLAIDQIDYVLSNPSHLSVDLINLDPLYDPLRDNPRFQELLKEYGG